MPNKALGQHWLRDRSILENVAAPATLSQADTVLEIGPGLGTLTSVLLARAGRVFAVEFDPELARKLPAQFPGTELTVAHQDILSFDLAKLPAGYKVVANVPYYITSKIIEKLLQAENKPVSITLLVQKEVAERLAAQPGGMSVLALSAQIFAEVSLHDIVPAELFTPPPKVDSQIVFLKILPKPRVAKQQEKLFFRVVKAGFSAKRKKLRSSLAGGLHLSKDDADALLKNAKISGDRRAEDLNIEEWLQLVKEFNAYD